MRAARTEPRPAIPRSICVGSAESSVTADCVVCGGERSGPATVPPQGSRVARTIDVAPRSQAASPPLPSAERFPQRASASASRFPFPALTNSDAVHYLPRCVDRSPSTTITAGAAPGCPQTSCPPRLTEPPPASPSPRDRDTRTSRRASHRTPSGSRHIRTPSHRIADPASSR